MARVKILKLFYKITLKISVKIKEISLFPMFVPTSVYEGPDILKGLVILSISPKVKILCIFSFTILVYNQNKE